MERTEKALREAFVDRSVTAYELTDLLESMARMQLSDLELRHEHQRLRMRLELLLECRLPAATATMPATPPPLPAPMPLPPPQPLAAIPPASSTPILPPSPRNLSENPIGRGRILALVRIFG